METGRDDLKTLLTAGIAAARSGQRARARALLARVTQEDEENLLAWLWLAGLVDDPEERRACLDHVLTIDPDNAAAKKGLAQLEAQSPQPATDPPDRLLKEGIAAARAGRREDAHDLFMQALAQDDRNVTAWLWLSGLVDSLEEQEICLENALTIDPDNRAARKKLEQIREQALPSPASTSPSPPPQTAEPPQATQPTDPLSDEYLCPYCAEPTAHDDRRCPSCGEKLWLNFRRNEKRSTNMWIIIALQAFSTLRNAIIPGGVLLILYGLQRGSDGAFGAILETYMQTSGTDMETMIVVLSIVLAVSLIPFLISLGVLIGLFLRWKPIFYLLLGTAILDVLRVGLAVLGSALSQNPVYGIAGGGYIDAILSVGAAIFRVVLAFQIQDDFAFERQRITLRIDPDVNSAPMILSRGYKYAKLKLWALSALHLRRATAMRPNSLDGRSALVLVYLKLGWLDLAERVLADARQIDPGNAQIEELAALLEKERAAPQPSERGPESKR